MPKVTITDNKGLVQAPGSGLTVNSTTDFKAQVHFQGNQVHGHTKKVVIISTSSYGTNSAQHHLSGADSGKTFIIGDVPGVTRTIVLPAASAGWEATFVTTGSLTNSSRIVLTGSHSGLTATSVPFGGSVIEASDGSASEAIVVSSDSNTGTGVTVNATNGTSAAGDKITVTLVASSAQDYMWVVDGQTAQ